MYEDRTPMPMVAAYLSFDGRCAEAMEFYGRTLDARLQALLRFADTPMGAGMAPAAAQRVMHACLVLPDGSILMAGDAPADVPFAAMQGFGMALTLPTPADAQRVFDALAEGGQVQMPLAPAFWAQAFGMVTDRYGTPWLVNGGPIPV
ncbi:MAG: VOC family protein [Steroidobacteraceae bacterium]|jgi:PhnB protein|nr:VOC family protein [Steroidobacteraceae bacterium]